MRIPEDPIEDPFAKCFGLQPGTETWGGSAVAAHYPMPGRSRVGPVINRLLTSFIRSIV